MRRQQRLKPAPGAAWTQVIPPEFFHELFLSVDNSMPFLYLCFGRIALSPLTAAVESSVVRRNVRLRMACLPLDFNIECIVSRSLPLWKGAALCLLFQLWFIRNCRKNLRIFAFEFHKIRTTRKADIPSRLPRGAPPA